MGNSYKTILISKNKTCYKGIPPSDFRNLCKGIPLLYLYKPNPCWAIELAELLRVHVFTRNNSSLVWYRGDKRIESAVAKRYT